MTKIFLAISLIIFILLIPTVSYGQILPAFGGFVTSLIPCTCSGNVWLFMSPFFNPSVPTSGALVYQPGVTTVYRHYIIPAVGVWLLGNYIPGVQSCFIYVGIACALVPGFGMINTVGTSL